MKKLLSILLSVIMLLGLMSINVFAEESIKVKLVNYHDKDGNFIAEKYIDFDVAPSIIDGRTMVPIRAVAEELGYYVCYDNDTGAYNRNYFVKRLQRAIDKIPIFFTKTTLTTIFTIVVIIEINIGFLTSL